MKDKLIQSASKEALQQNIKTEIEAGKDPKQAAAIAYSVQRANDAANVELLYCVIEFTESGYFGLTSKVGKQISLDEADTLIRNADKAYQTTGKKGLYDKTYLDLYVRYNNHKYRIHLLRFDIGDGPTHMNVKEKVNNVLNRVPELVNDNRYRAYNYVKQLDTGTEIESCGVTDGYGGEIHNISGKVFRGSDGKLYQMPNNSFAIYNKDKQGYYGFRKDNNMPYVPIGGRSALQSILNDGGFISLDGLVFVRPIRDSKSYKIKIGDKQYKLVAPNKQTALSLVERFISVNDGNQVLREYHKLVNSELQTGQLIKHNNGFTFVSTNPKEDKDSNSISQLESYISSLGFKPIY